MPESNNYLYILFTFSIFCLSGQSLQGAGLNAASEEEIVRMHGHVYDTISEAPAVLNVKANIVLESMPHGSEIGIITSNDSSGYYEYYVNLAHNYKITIRSELYSVYYEDIDLKKFVSDGEIARDFYLRPQLKENQVIRLKKLIFEQGKSSITPESYGELNKLYGLLTANPAMRIQLEGHTDYRGNKRLNMELSEQRVKAVRAYLLGKGIASKRVKTKAFGGANPLTRESSLEASQINRRVEVRILKLD